MTPERELLRECLTALNRARRFNYGTIRRTGRSGQAVVMRPRFGKPDSYDLAARIEEHFRAQGIEPYGIPSGIDRP